MFVIVQGNISEITIFGKFSSSAELESQATTVDQAQCNFKPTVFFSEQNQEGNLKKVAEGISALHERNADR